MLVTDHKFLWQLGRESTFGVWIGREDQRLLGINELLGRWVCVKRIMDGVEEERERERSKVKPTATAGSSSNGFFTKLGSRELGTRKWELQNVWLSGSESGPSTILTVLIRKRN